MQRPWLGPGLALVLGGLGFAFALWLDASPGSSGWPGGPEIVVVIALAATLAVALGLAHQMDGWNLQAAGLVVLAAGVGFGLAWLGFMALLPSGLDCGYTPVVHAEGGFAGNWSNANAREALETHGLAIRDENARRVSGTNTLEGDTRVGVSLSLEAGPPGTEANATGDPIGFRMDFRSPDSLASSSAAQNWSAENRDRFEQRLQAFREDVTAATGWRPTGNVSWHNSSMVC